jgi:hypothetical protein
LAIFEYCELQGPIHTPPSDTAPIYILFYCSIAVLLNTSHSSLLMVYKPFTTFPMVFQHIFPSFPIAQKFNLQYTMQIRNFSNTVDAV